jgi:hypothetical protein
MQRELFQPNHLMIKVYYHHKLRGVFHHQQLMPQHQETFRKPVPPVASSKNGINTFILLALPSIMA